MNRSVVRALALSVLCGVAWSAPSSAQTLRGTILDSTTGAPVMLAYVGLLGEGRTMIVADLASSDGDFSLEAPEGGSYFLYVSRAGYEPLMDGVFELGEDGDFDVRIGLSPLPIELEPVTVEAEADLSYLERQGFYERAIADRGTFLIREDIERLAPYHIADAFRGIPFLSVDASLPLTSAFGAMAHPRLYVRRADQGRSCSPTLYVDRHVVASGLNEDVRPDDYVNPSEVDAIEVYPRSSDVPLEFNEVNDCGVILIWTRAR